MPQTSPKITFNINYNDQNKKITIVGPNVVNGTLPAESEDVIIKLSKMMLVGWLVSPPIGFPRWNQKPTPPLVIKGFNSFKAGELLKAKLIASSLGFDQNYIQSNNIWPVNDVTIEITFTPQTGKTPTPKGWKYPANIKNVIPDLDGLTARAFLAVVADDSDQFIKWVEAITEQNMKVARLRAASYGYEIEFFRSQ